MGIRSAMGRSAMGANCSNSQFALVVVVAAPSFRRLQSPYFQKAPKRAPNFCDCRRTPTITSGQLGRESIGFPGFIQPIMDVGEWRNGAQERTRI